MVTAALSLVACDPNVPPEGGVVESADKQPHRKRRGVPPGTHEGESTSLLAAHAERDLYPKSEIDGFKLTGNAKTLAVAMLTVGAKDRIEDLPDLLTTDAGWGLPDAREVGRRGIMDDDGEAFMTSLRDAASRFKKDAPFNCPPIMPAMETYVSTGAEPMWCFYSSDDKLDLLVFKLVAVGGHARIGYVGLFGERPARQMRVIGAGAPPPTRPPPKMRGLDKPGGGPTVIGPEGMQVERVPGGVTPPPRPPTGAAAPAGAPADAPAAVEKKADDEPKAEKKAEKKEDGN
jgi:hypothetical protein